MVGFIITPYRLDILSLQTISVIILGEAELEMMWGGNSGVKVQSQHWKSNMRNLYQFKWYTGRHSNRLPPEYKLQTLPHCLPVYTLMFSDVCFMDMLSDYSTHHS
jgi:hypothetical protein